MSQSETHIIFYTDDDVNGEAIRWARNLGVQIVTANEAGNRGADDPIYFDYAAAHGYVLVTGNIRDFEALFYRWAESGREHPGMVLIRPEVRTSAGWIAQELQILFEAASPEYMINRIWRI